MKQTICIAGKNNIAVDFLQYLMNIYKNDNFLCIINKSDKGINTWQKSLLKYCKNNNIKIVNLCDVYDIDDLLFLSLEFDQLIDTNKFKSKRLFNIHFSLLPKYKGMYTSSLPILFNEKETGVTLHLINNGIDTGDIIANKSFKISQVDTAYDIYKKLIKNGIELLINNFDFLYNNTYTSYKQEIIDSSYYSKKIIDYNNLSLNINNTSFQIYNQIRAYSFRPYQFVKYNNQDIVEAKFTNEVSIKKPGEIVEENDYYIKICTIDYNLILYKDLLNDLLESIKNNENSIAKNLCTCNSIINGFNNYGHTPLIVATYENNIEMVEFLLSCGANIKDVNNNGTNLLMYAKEAYKKYNDNTLFKKYISMGLDINKKDYNGNDLLYYLDIDNIKMSELIK